MSKRPNVTSAVLPDGTTIRKGSRVVVIKSPFPHVPAAVTGEIVASGNTRKILVLGVSGVVIGVWVRIPAAGLSHRPLGADYLLPLLPLECLGSLPA